MDNTKDIGGRNQANPEYKKGKNYLLAIGIDDYAHCDKLHNAVKDITDFVALMKEKFGFDDEDTDIRVLRNVEATAESILNALTRLIQVVEPTDNVLIYFSGHGDFDETLDEGCWIPVEAKVGQRSRYIPNDRINRVLSRIKSFHTFLIIDSCYSGSMFLEGQGKFMPDAYNHPSRWGLTSGRNTIVSDGKAGTNSPFATALLNALRRTEQPMNVSALCDLVKQAVPAATNKLQMPIGEPLNTTGHAGGQFIFSPKIKMNPEVAAWEAVQAIHTEVAYSRFLRQNVRSPFADDAEKALDELTKARENAEEDAFWKEVVKQHSMISYNRYLRRYKDGRYMNEVDKRLDALEDAASVVQPIPNSTIIPPKKFDFEPEMIFVKGGIFSRKISGWFGLSRKTQEITLTDFSIGKYPITQWQWEAVMSDNPSCFKGISIRPVENVSWEDCQVFIQKLNEKTGKKYSLPTEAQWEFAARGGTQSRDCKYSGSNNIGEVAHYSYNSAGSTNIVGKKKPNELGIYDMTGNVSEWCYDLLGDYSNTTVIDPTGASSGSERVFRGGNWDSPALLCSVSTRFKAVPTYRHYVLGFRVVCLSQ